ncbi:hypothetical protein PIB30_044696 [Stylosanthes scabra]|uniref:Uncharacterized protein n=1 Tax=Stylosanthes scabra TaxID=79078 RepID=A0ABU6SGM1_9FABA|nr:hypothetical protein [Stylosanthes scabra]
MAEAGIRGWPTGEDDAVETRLRQLEKMTRLEETTRWRRGWQAGEDDTVGRRWRCVTVETRLRRRCARLRQKPARLRRRCDAEQRWATGNEEGRRGFNLGGRGSDDYSQVRGGEWRRVTERGGQGFKVMSSG